MKVSVKIITYNHEKFIAQAIDSILMQKVNFDYEIVIGEDCSTDNTRDIVIDYQKRYPDKIRLLLPEKNLGARKNSNQTLRACQGEYVAWLEGDDYWTSPHKLQKQVDFLDNHLECAMCFHATTIVYEDGGREPRNYRPPNLKKFFTLEDVLINNFIATGSVMFRGGLVVELPEEFSKLKMGDWPRHVLTAQYGKIGYIDEIMGVYRYHKGGVWTRGGGWSIDDYIRMKTASLEFYEVINKYLGYKYNDILSRKISKNSRFLADAYRKQENWKNMRQYLLKGFFAQPFNNDISFSFLVKSLLLSFFPNVYFYLRDQYKKIKFGKQTGFKDTETE